MAALQASGAISFQDIEEQYNPGSNLPSRALTEFYLGGSLVRANAGNNSSTNMSAGVPTSGVISFNDFYSKERAFKKTYSSTATNQSADSVFGDDFEVDYPKQIVVNGSVTVGSTSTSNPALKVESNGVGSITITNNGSIEGAGGAVAAAGGDALEVAGSVAVTLVNNGTIKAGGGGGGAGGAGGNGVFTANATFSSLVDEGGGGSSTPANNKPSWLNSIYTSAGNLDGVGVVGNRLWRGINQQFNRSGGIGQSGQFQINHAGGSGDGFNANCANRGPIYISAETNQTGIYTVVASISSQYGSGYGTPTISVSTSTSSAGTSVSNSGTANITSGQTIYFTAYGTTSNGANYYYNSLSMSVSGTCTAISTGGSAGSGGVGQGYNQSAGSGSSGGSAGGTNAGAGGAGGAGGSFGSAGANGTNGANGSGTTISFPSSAPTNGTSGSSGGASGKSIQGVSNVTSSGSGSLSGGTA
tara:strand:+ start:666 stop:2081 length:1416 start_codon:yes stop_codon:yes gene_type:complete